ncbi:Glucose-6-phosphate isomerase, partial [Frankliniella fusca]
WTRFQPAADSPAAACLRSGSGPALPGLWTPLTPITKAATMQTLFPDDTDLLTRPPPPPSLLPPSLVHVFPSARCKDVLAAAALHDGAVTGSGFFSEQREPLAADEAEFEALQREKEDSDVFVVAVSVEAVAATEALAALQPIAVSASAEEGLADCDAYFPGPVQEEEDDEDVDDANLLG